MALTKAQLVDLNANELIIDLDADTSITADTDDQIDIKIAGADDFRFTANTFTALSGSTIAAQALTATTLTTTGAIAIANDGNIGSAGDADAIAISSSGVVTFSQTPVLSGASLTAGTTPLTTLDIDGGTDIGAAIADADLFIIDDGAGGTNRKTTAARIKTYIGGGITEFDMYRLTADQSGGTNAVISSNLERVDDATFQKIGTGMSESSGVYTFPSTGKYLVSVHARIYAISDSNATVLIDASSNSGSNYDELVNVNAGNGNSSSTNTTVSGQALVDVTNASNFRVRFQTESMGSSSLLSGNTSSNYTTFSFLRLGDT